MKDMLCEGVIKLSDVHECMIKAMGILEMMDKSKDVLEKNAYESMNATDTALNLSDKGLILVGSLKACSHTLKNYSFEEKQEQMDRLLDVLTDILELIQTTATLESEYLHAIEEEVACHWELSDILKNKLYKISDSLDQTVACAELILAIET